MSLSPHLLFKGNCREALDYYTQVFDTSVENLKFYGDLPEDAGFPLSEKTKKTVFRASLSILGTEVFLSDLPPGMIHKKGASLSLRISGESEERSRQVFDALAAGGIVIMKLCKMPWSRLYGVVRDRFGISWQLDLS
jgi:PhnB protein